MPRRVERRLIVRVLTELDELAVAEAVPVHGVPAVLDPVACGALGKASTSTSNAFWT
jgi:hypothetical protein